jgi:hypothetical protein
MTRFHGSLSDVQSSAVGAVRFKKNSLRRGGPQTLSGIRRTQEVSRKGEVEAELQGKV